MNLTKLFELQKALDDRIIDEKGLEGQDLYRMKVMALQVELAELAQEIGDVWKFWKEGDCRDTVRVLEELVDCLHFLISIGIDARVKPAERRGKLKALTTFDQLEGCFRYFPICYVSLQWETAFAYFWGLTEMLGFDWEDVEAAYIQKNEINHHRQAAGY